MERKMKSILIHAPINEQPQLNQIWAIVSVDEGGEGIVAAPTMQGVLTIPLITGEERLLDSMKAMARSVSAVTGKKMRLVKFSQREVVEEIT